MEIDHKKSYRHSPPFRWIIQEVFTRSTGQPLVHAYPEVWLDERTIPPLPQLLTWDVKQQNKQVSVNMQG